MTETKRMKLSQWAASVGITYQTAHKHFHAGLLPAGVRGMRTPSGALVVDVEEVLSPSEDGDRLTVIEERLADVQRTLGRIEEKL